MAIVVSLLEHYGEQTVLLLEANELIYPTEKKIHSFVLFSFFLLQIECQRSDLVPGFFQAQKGSV